MGERDATHLVKQFDGLVTIKNPDGIYQDTVGNFSLDAGTPFPRLPAGFIGRIYIPGEKHSLIARNKQEPQRLPWVPGDDLLFMVADLLASQEARAITDPQAPLSQLRLNALEALLERKAGDADVSVAETDYQAARSGRQ